MKVIRSYAVAVVDLFLRTIPKKRGTLKSERLFSSAPLAY